MTVLQSNTLHGRPAQDDKSSHVGPEHQAEGQIFDELMPQVVGKIAKQVDQVVDDPMPVKY